MREGAIWGEANTVVDRKDAREGGRKEPGAELAAVDSPPPHATDGGAATRGSTRRSVR